MVRKVLRVVFATLSLAIGLYPVIYFTIDRQFGLLASKPMEILTNVFWNIGFYTHIIFGGLALLIGWIQFSPGFRNKNPILHKKTGKVYVTSVLLSSVAGIGIGFFATGGLWSSLGFICLGVIWFYTTLMGYTTIRKRQVEVHQKFMVYSYAACFAAVTLRIWLPLLIVIHGEFMVAYTIVAWLSWVPNLLVANLIARRIKPMQTVVR